MKIEKLLYCQGKQGKPAQLRKIDENGEIYYIIDGPNGSIESYDYSEAVEIYLDEVSIIAYSQK